MRVWWFSSSGPVLAPRPVMMNLLELLIRNSLLWHMFCRLATTARLYNQSSYFFQTPNFSLLAPKQGKLLSFIRFPGIYFPGIGDCFGRVLEREMEAIALIFNFNFHFLIVYVCNM